MKILIMTTTLSMLQWQKNLITTLLKMEMLMLVTVMTLLLCTTNYHYMNTIIMLTMMVISSTLGISLTILMTRANKTVSTKTTW